MGRFRVFKSKNNTTTSSEYNKTKVGITILKDMSSKNAGYNKSDSLFCTSFGNRAANVSDAHRSIKLLIKL